MWPAAGSGFEADPFSPAGTAQRQWLLIRRLRYSRGGMGFVWVILALLVAVLIAALLSSLV